LHIVSIHAPAKGATQERNPFRGVGRCFNPRAREGRDEDIDPDPDIIHAFQSTRPRRARL